MTWLGRGLLAGLLMWVGEIGLWLDPIHRTLPEWLLLGLGYLALAALIADLKTRWHIQETISLLVLAGLYGLLNSLLLNPDTALSDVPRTWITHAMGAQTLAGLLALLAWQYALRGRHNALWLGTLIAGVIWGVWIRGLESLGTISVPGLPTLLALLLIAGLLLIGVPSLVMDILQRRHPRPVLNLCLTRAEGAGVVLALGTLFIIRKPHIDQISLVVLISLSLYCLLMLWFDSQYSAAPPKTQQPLYPITTGMVLIHTLAGLASLSLLPALFSNTLAPLLVMAINTLGLVWLPTVSVILGIRAYRTQSRQQTL